jgi:predicted nucleic acid-binding protein
VRIILDTNVLIGELPDLDPTDQLSVSSVTYAELVAGTRLTPNAADAAGRVRRLPRAGAIDGAGLPFDDAAAASYAALVDVVRRSGRGHRSRTADLMIAATANARGAALLTNTVDDLIGLSDAVVVLDGSARRT